MFWFLVYAIGFVCVLKFLIECVYTFLVYHVLPEKLNRVEGAWAIVTGASRGIGKTFALFLAQRGFNIILISRSQNTLRKIAKKIQQQYKVETRVLGVDLSQLYKDQRIKQQINELFKQYKCQILVLNAGTSRKSLFADLSMKQIQTTFFLNTHHHVYFSKLFLSEHPDIQKYLIHMSSILAVNVCSTASLYGATKNFSDILARFQSYQSSTNILSVRPFFVDTDMIEEVKEKILVATPEDIVKYSLKCVGWKNVCRGTWKHIFFHYVAQLVPNRLWATLTILAFKLK